ncbi:MAG: ABC-type transport auxiliary lipoprotein family protein [Burkholderiaceae bacterium]
MKRRVSWAAAAAIGVLLAACSTLPMPPAAPVYYDLGPGADPGPTDGAPAGAAPLVLDRVTARGLPATGQLVLYRHAYADAYQLQAYRQARWSRPVETLLAQQLARRLQVGRPVLTPDQAGIRGFDSERPPAVLIVDLERFEQVFDDPDRSSGVVRLQATLLMPRGLEPSGGDRLLAQRRFEHAMAASRADAAGGAQALAQASRAVADDLDAWLRSMGR